MALKTELYSPTRLGLNAVDNTSTGPTTGNFINVEGLQTAVLVITSTGTNPAGHIRVLIRDINGSDLPAFALRGASAPPFQFTDPHIISMGPGRGVIIGEDSTTPSLAGTIIGLSVIRFQLDVTTIGGGTTSFFMYGQRRA